MARTDPQINFRIPAALKSEIESAAEAANRTVTAEIVARLQASFTQNRTDTMERIAENMERLRESQERMEKRDEEMLKKLPKEAEAKGKKPSK